jgi:hypothetical protein
VDKEMQINPLTTVRQLTTIEAGTFSFKEIEMQVRINGQEKVVSREEAKALKNSCDFGTTSWATAMHLIQRICAIENNSWYRQQRIRNTIEHYRTEIDAESDGDLKDHFINTLRIFLSELK